jgi:hypothetical protein
MWVGLRNLQVEACVAMLAAINNKKIIEKFALWVPIESIFKPRGYLNLVSRAVVLISLRFPQSGLHMHLGCG